MTLLDTKRVLGRSLLSLVKNQLPINIVIFFEYNSVQTGYRGRISLISFPGWWPPEGGK